MCKELMKKSSKYDNLLYSMWCIYCSVKGRCLYFFEIYLIVTKWDDSLIEIFMYKWADSSCEIISCVGWDCHVWA